jgi:hypothetical protein
MTSRRLRPLKRGPKGLVGVEDRDAGKQNSLSPVIPISRARRGPSLFAPPEWATDPNSAILDITAALYADASAKAIVYRENDRG